MLNWFKSLLNRRGSIVSRITANDEEISIDSPNQQRIAIPWRDVKRISVYKRDLITTDEILLAVESSSTPSSIQISEESPGFADLFGPMERALGVSPAWYREIMLPAFAATPRVIYQRATDGEPT